MYRKELNERSPLRVFERSIHGGLGAGNLGLVLSRPGVGKSAFLVGVALDDLMRGRKVLHISVDNANVERVRAYYEELFNELAESAHLEDRAATHLSIERNRMIQTYTHRCFELGKVRSGIKLAQEHMNFEPDLIVIEGFPDLDSAEATALDELHATARELECEMWLAGVSHRESKLDARGIPESVARFDDKVAVVVALEPNADRVHLRLLKDHDSPDVANLHIELDPKTLLLMGH